MKIHKILLSFALFFCIFMNAQNEFITVWKPSNASTVNIYGGITSTNTQIWIPGIGTNFNVSWEEVGYPSHSGNLNNITSTENFLLDFGIPFNPIATNATYRVKITNGNGAFEKVKSKNGNGLIGDVQKILKIEQWGNIIWTNMDQAYDSCINLDVIATDIPNLNNVTSLELIFNNCTSLVGNQSFSNWSTFNIINMKAAFQGCILFNQPIGNWNTSNVTTMSGIFNGTYLFNQPLANWDTSNVVYFDYMFSAAKVFNQPIGNWDVSNAVDIKFMFINAKKFNQPIGNWNTGNVSNFQNVFSGASDFNQPIGTWDTSSGTTFIGMFQFATSFNQDIGNWNTSSAALMDFMFRNAVSFNKEIPNWNTSNVYGMTSMFQNATLFNSNIGTWNTGSLLYMDNIFNNATSFNQNISGWNTSNVYDMSNSFSGASAFNQNLGTWNLSSLSSANYMLTNSGLDCANYDLTLIGWSSNPATPNNINLNSVANLVYASPSSVIARNNLLNNKNWTFSGDLYDPNCETRLSTAENINNNEISIYPNPTSDFLNITTKLKIDEAKILDTSGRIILNIKNLTNKVDVTQLSKGNYILQLTFKEGARSFKFIKK